MKSMTYYLMSHFFLREFFNRIGQQQSFEQTNIGRACVNFVKLIASIEDPVVAQKIIAHLDEKVTPTGTCLLPQCRPPPATGLLI